MFLFKISLLPLTILSLSSQSHAVEGMWQPEQFPVIKKQLVEAGLEFPPEKIAQLTQFPMNSIVSLGGCSASFVSKDGLVITNHHCAYGSIQFNSTPDHNLLQDGFYAAKRHEELKAAPGSRIFVTEDITDVTTTILKDLEKTNGLKRYKTIQNRQKSLIAQCEKAAGYRCRIDSFYGQSSYRLTKQLEIRDVRLVEAPPTSIGAYGGDVDNWMWPRHAGDFAFYRAYVGADGRPADFHKSNVPYQPKGFLKVANQGVKDGSFVMVAGYPGRTNRHRLPKEVQYKFEQDYPRIRNHLDARIQLIEKLSKKVPEIKIIYASKLAGLNNYSKNAQGKLDGHKSIGLSSIKKAQEQSFLDNLTPAIKKDATRTYSNLNQLVERQHEFDTYQFAMRKLKDSALLNTAERLYRLAHEKAKPDLERERGYQSRDMNFFRQRLERLSKRFHQEMDRSLWSLGIQEIKDGDLKIARPLPKPLQNLVDLSPAKREAKLEAFYQASSLKDQKSRVKLMNASVAELKGSQDPFIKLAIAIYDHKIKLEREGKALQGDLQKARSAYMKYLKQTQEKMGQAIYADANSTLRVSFGTVQGTTNRDGQSFSSITVAEEIAQKHTGKDPFKAPEGLLNLIKSKNYQPYTLPKSGTVPVNFLADLDITGGNSGSATLNSKAEITGLVFDGTIEGVISDWAFDPVFTKSIHVDIRYILWILDKFQNAQPLLQELGIPPRITH